MKLASVYRIVFKNVERLPVVLVITCKMWCSKPRRNQA